MARLEVSGEVREVGDGITIVDAVSSMGLHPDSFLYVIGGRPVPMDTVLRAGDLVRVVRVASGG